MSESKLEHAYLNPLQLNISMHNLQPVLYMVIFSYMGLHKNLIQ